MIKGMCSILLVSLLLTDRSFPLEAEYLNTMLSTSRNKDQMKI